MPALLHHVLRVIVICSKEQMIQVNASPIVASVTNAQSFWDWPMSHFECKPVSVIFPTFSYDKGVTFRMLFNLRPI